MRQRNYAPPETKVQFFVGQDVFGLAVTEGYNPGERSLRQYWIYYHEENCFDWKVTSLFDGAKIVGNCIRDTILSDNELFPHRLNDSSKLICSYVYRHTPSQYFAIYVDKNGDTKYGIYDSEKDTFIYIFDLLETLVRSAK